MSRNCPQDTLSTPRSEVRTPIRLGSRSRGLGGQNAPSVGSPDLEVEALSSRPTSANNVRVNDDEEEKKQRRQNNMINVGNVLSPGCHTPRSAHSGRSRPVESATSSLSNAQLAEHYADCIKLSTQNKINAKNAFGLHLIDHMFTMLKQKGDITNFQVASSTLDAGAKIYAGRVDSIYNDAYKVLGGLGSRDHSSKDQEEDQEREGEGGEGDHEASKKRGHKLKKTGTCVTIEKDPSVLNIADFEMDFRADPLFRKTAAAFDEGGVSGLLLKNIPVRDDSCTLQLDSSQSLILMDKPSVGVMMDVDRDLVDFSALESRQICPTFANFKFTDSPLGEEEECVYNANPGGEEVEPAGDDGGGGGDPLQIADFTMLDAPPTPSQDTCDNYDDGSTTSMREDLAPSQGELSVLGICNDNQMAQFLPGLSEIHSEKTSRPLPPGLGGLCLTDIIDPSEYSYFKPAVMASWAGPQHWKFRPRNMTKTTEIEREKETKKRKTAPFQVDFRNDTNKSLFASGKASTRLSKAALKKLDSSLNTLPQETHTNVDVLHRLFSRPKWKVKRQKMESGIVEEDLEGDWYNYGNANDKLNYCPDVDGVHDDSDNDNGMDETALGFFNTSQVFNETMLPDRGEDSQPSSQQGELEGENLISQPHKVEKVRIDYAKTSKKIDVKKLKTRMWDFISDPQQQEETHEQQDSSSAKDTETTMTSPNSAESGDAPGVEFSSLCSHLPSLISAGMAKNVTVPICFVCLLHLANEKELKLASKSDDLSDFRILTSP